jgi:aminoglycoside/choline kinase family phosphotransferase
MASWQYGMLRITFTDYGPSKWAIQWFGSDGESPPEEITDFAAGIVMLNQLGREGWEIVATSRQNAVYYGGNMTFPEIHEYLAKRPGGREDGAERSAQNQGPAS